MPKLHLVTYGCQMNEYDSERVAGLLKDERYELTDSPDEADLILVNTCAIREKAEDKVYSQLGTLKRLKAERPGLLIGVMGCMAQLQQERIQQRAPHVDLVFGSPAIARVVELVARARAERRPVLEPSEGPGARTPTPGPRHSLPISRPRPTNEPSDRILVRRSLPVPEVSAMPSASILPPSKSMESRRKSMR